MGDVRHVVFLDDPQASDVDLDNRKIYITGVPPIPYNRVLNEPAEVSAATETVKQADYAPSVSNNTEYYISITQYVSGRVRNQIYKYPSGSNADAEAIVDEFVSQINNDGTVNLSASRQSSGASSELRIEGVSGYPYFIATFDSNQWGETVNTNAVFAQGQGDDLIAAGFDDATSGNSYALWRFEAVTNLDGGIGGPNEREDEWLIYANEGGGTFSNFQSELNNIVQGNAPGGGSTTENVALSG